MSTHPGVMYLARGEVQPYLFGGGLPLHPSEDDDRNPSARGVDVPLKDDVLPGVSAIAAYSGHPERRIRHFIEVADQADEAGDTSRSRFPFTRRGGLIISRKSWLDAWHSGEDVDVPRGDPRCGRGPRKKATEPEPAPERISARTGEPVRRYRRRAGGGQ